ncbi:MAG: BamA/TamA family outer membrane protein, partial [Bacteroidota bacterium]|nr:BamA/TamA family outer membrane protein [Bacteroidota bacterium]
EILLVKVFPDSSFTSYLNNLTDKRLKNQYIDHIVAGLKYTISITNQEVDKVKNFFFLKSNFETGGNLLYCLAEIMQVKKTSSGYYNFFEIPFAQYIKPDIDFRYYQMKSKNVNFVYRFYGGIGIPYGNSNALPFEKAFFGGGANDLRGWKMGTLGPGSYHNDTLTNSFDQTGDLQLQANFEFRFPIYKYFKSALFVDAGNVWLLHNLKDLPGGKFELNRFLSQIAIDAGIGIRADFDYCILRFDPAFPVRVPYYSNNMHWYINKIQLKDIIWNFGIGYPF